MGLPRGEYKVRKAKPRFRFHQQPQDHCELPIENPVISCRIDDVVSEGSFVQVHRNLTSGTISIRLSGKVVGHADRVLLDNVKFKVKKSGMKFIGRNFRKSVVPIAEGWLVQMDGFTSYKNREAPSCGKFMYIHRKECFSISFNPYVSYKFRKGYFVGKQYELDNVAWITIDKSGQMEGGFK